MMRGRQPEAQQQAGGLFFSSLDFSCTLDSKVLLLMLLLMLHVFHGTRFSGPGENSVQK